MRNDQDGLIEVIKNASLVIAGSGDIIGPEHQRSAFIDRMGSCMLAGLPPGMMDEATWKKEFKRKDGRWQSLWQDFVRRQTGKTPSEELVNFVYKDLWYTVASLDRLPGTRGIYELFYFVDGIMSEFAVVSGQFAEITKLVVDMYGFVMPDSLIVETKGNSKRAVDEGYRTLLGRESDGDVVILDTNTDRMGYVQQLKRDWCIDGVCGDVTIIGVNNRFVTDQKAQSGVCDYVFGSVEEVVRALGLEIDEMWYKPRNNRMKIAAQQRLLQEDSGYEFLLQQWNCAETR